MDLRQFEFGVLVGGEWRRGRSAERLPIVDPSSGESVGEIAAGSSADVDEAVAAARAAASSWGKMSATERGRVLSRMGAKVSESVDRLAQLEALDVGKPLRQARADAVALARYLEFYGGAADKLHGETIPYQPGYTVYTLYEPHGVTAHIIPWNYPMQIVGRSVIAALAMGNAAVLKPAEQTCLTTLAFARIASEAGLPAGVLNVVAGSGPEAGAALAAHPGIHHLSFTGSTTVGVRVQQAAAANIVPVPLELGGKSPQIIFDDADIERVLPSLVAAGMQNAGQTCSAGSRILVQRGIYDQVAQRLAERIARLTAGPGLADLDLGPLISARQKHSVEAYIAQGDRELKRIARGAISNEASKHGFYVAPAVFADVPPRHRLAQEEIFGPVLVLIPFTDEDDAVEIANGTPYGLVAGIWTRDGARQMRMAKALRAGQVFLNNYGAAGGVELPFGGVGHSGFGREKGMAALKSFCTIKTVAAYHG